MRERTAMTIIDCPMAPTRVLILSIAETAINRGRYEQIPPGRIDDGLDAHRGAGQRKKADQEDP